MRKPTRRDGEELIASAKTFGFKPPRIQSIFVEIGGTADMIQNRFSQKALEQMLRKHMGMAVERENKKPRQLIEEAKVVNTDGRVCVPSTAIKKAMLTASAQLKNLKKTQLRISFFVVGNSVPIVYESMEPRMDMVRTAGIGRTPDVRFRPAFKNWKARFEIQFSDNISMQAVMDLLYRAGQVGLCEWRPEKDGSFGTFKILRPVESQEERDEVRLWCAAPLEPLKIPDWAMDMEIDPVLLKKVFQAAESDGPPGELEEVG